MLRAITISFFMFGFGFITAAAFSVRAQSDAYYRGYEEGLKHDKHPKKYQKRCAICGEYTYSRDKDSIWRCRVCNADLTDIEAEEVDYDS